MVLKMKREVLTEVVKRLRSGDYKQGQEKLARKDQEGNVLYCCLGIICEMAVEAGVTTKTLETTEDWNEETDEFFEGEVYEYGGTSRETLPLEVVQWAGMKTEFEGRPKADDFDDFEGMGRFDPQRDWRAAQEDGVYTTLAGMNDNGVPFSDIADFMEKEVVPV